MLFRKKTRVQEPSNIPSEGRSFLTGEQLLKPHHLFVRNIRDNSRATDDFFSRYYLPCLYRFAEIIQLRPYGQEGEYARMGGALEAVIRRVEMALKLRLGKLLPTGVPAEEIQPREQCWTYGVFLAALLRESGGLLFNTRLIGFTAKHQMEEEWIGWADSLDKYAYYKMDVDTNVEKGLSRLSSIVLLNFVVPKAGMEWIFQDKKLLEELLSVLSGLGDYRNNAIYDLMIKSFKAALSDPAASFGLPDEAQQSQPSAVEAAEQKTDKATGEVFDGPPMGEPSMYEDPGQTPADKKSPPPQIPIDTAKRPDAEELVPDNGDVPTPVKTKRKKKTVSTKGFVDRVQKDLQLGLFDDDGAVTVEAENILLKYPFAFQLYTDSPADLLNELKAYGKVVEDRKKSGDKQSRMIVLKKNSN